MRLAALVIAIAAVGCGGHAGPVNPPVHSVQVTWTPSKDVQPLIGQGFYNIYGPNCPPSSKLGSTPAVVFNDANLPSGPRCYNITAEVNGVESPLSNTATVNVQ